MTIDLTDTSASAIYEALTEARRRLGGAALGMVLTLIVETSEAAQYDAMRAANHAGREHPCRVLGVITRRPNAESRLDAEIRVGETGPGETILLRMYGPVGQHADSVLAPLLVPDVPVVTWWPGQVPEVPSQSPLGALAQRRVTDSASGDSGAGVAGRAGRGVQARGHRLQLDPAHPVAHAARGHVRRAAPPHHAGGGARRAGQPERRHPRGLALGAAGRPGAARRVRGPGHHRRPVRDGERPDRHLPPRRPDRHAVEIR